MRKAIIGVVVVVAAGGGAAAFLAARSSTVPGARPDTTVLPDRLTVTQTAGLPTGLDQRPLEADITNPSQVAAIYHALLALPVRPTGPVSCPSGSGVHYRLVFLRGPGEVLRADVEASGCLFVSLSTGRDLWSVGVRGTRFWSLLARALHLTPQQLRGFPP